MNTRRDALRGAGSMLGAVGLTWLPAFGREAAGRARDTRAAEGTTRWPNTTLYTQDGTKVRFYDDLVRGKTVAINMMYVRCEDRCPMATHNLTRVQQLLGARAGRDVFLYSISVKPEEDTPAALKAYAEEHGVGPGWTFLTGAPDEIRRLRYRLGFFDIDPLVDGDAATHTGMVRIGDEPSDRWTSSASLALPEQILATINHVDPRMTHTVAPRVDESSSHRHG